MILDDGGDATLLLHLGAKAEADAGDHTFFIADVLSIEHGPSERALVYRESTYHSV